MPENDFIPVRMPIPNFPGYFAGSDGSIWSARPRGAATRDPNCVGPLRKLKPVMSRKTKYLQLTLCRDFEKHNVLVHAAVLLAFVGPPVAGQECRHLDGNRQNNRLENLKWGTRIENNQDKISHGRSLRGSLNTNAKLTESDVSEIRRLYLQGRRIAHLAKQFGITPTTTCKIVHRRVWKHVA